MIEAISAAQASQFPEEIEAMHRLRHRVFVEKLNWVEGSADGLERDLFDDLNPIYLLARGDRGNVIGTWRLLPTTGPYMLRNVFDELLAGAPAPAHARLWEGSRYAVDGAVQEAGGLGAVSRASRELFCGLVELCLELGIEEVLTVYDVHIARLLNRLGCKPTWCTGRRRIGNTLAMAGRFDISEAVLENLRAKAGIDGPVLHSRLLDTIQKAA